MLTYTAKQHPDQLIRKQLRFPSGYEMHGVSLQSHRCWMDAVDPGHCQGGIARRGTGLWLRTPRCRLSFWYQLMSPSWHFFSSLRGCLFAGAGSISPTCILPMVLHPPQPTLLLEGPSSQRHGASETPDPAVDLGRRATYLQNSLGFGGGRVVGFFSERLCVVFFSPLQVLLYFLFKIILCLKEAVCHRVSLMLPLEEPELQAVEMNRVCQDNCGR